MDTGFPWNRGLNFMPSPCSCTVALQHLGIRLGLVFSPGKADSALLCVWDKPWRAGGPSFAHWHHRHKHPPLLPRCGHSRRVVALLPAQRMLWKPCSPGQLQPISTILYHPLYAGSLHSQTCSTGQSPQTQPPPGNELYNSLFSQAGKGAVAASCHAISTG